MDHFFPLKILENRTYQFIYLTQGMMIVDQYATKFVELSHFTNYLIPNKEKKVEKFENVLVHTKLWSE